MPPRPKKTPTEMAAGRAARGLIAHAQGFANTNRRKAFEASSAGSARMTSLVKPLGGETLADAYQRHGFSDDAIHPHGQQELPGMEHPDVVPQRRWEEMHPSEQKKVTDAAARFGVTRDSAKQAFGAQVDQAHYRAAQHGAEPHSMRFYSDNHPETSGVHTPKSRLVQSAKENNVSLSTQVVANAITSPKSTFERTAKTGNFAGQRIYPNDMNATAAIKVAQAGLPHTEARAVPGVGGLHGNSQRAAYAVGQKLRGVPNSELKNPSGSPVFGPKTGPYHNSWVDPHGSSQFLTSDIHTGGGGFAPHLPVGAEGARGGPNSGQSREDYLSIPGIHQFHDHIAREVMKERGLQSLTGLQAAQWGEERINRGLESEQSAFRQQREHAASKQPKLEQHPGQGSLF